MKINTVIINIGETEYKVTSYTGELLKLSQLGIKTDLNYPDYLHMYISNAALHVMSMAMNTKTGDFPPVNGNSPVFGSDFTFYSLSGFILPYTGEITAVSDIDYISINIRRGFVLSITHINKK